MIEIRDLIVSVGEKTVLDKIDLKIEPGNLHVLMGKNGSGKSSLAYTLMGHPKFFIQNGQIKFFQENLIDMPVEKRARSGIFLACQNPVEIPGVSVFTFLKEAYRVTSGHDIEATDFKKILINIFELANLDYSFAYRNFNEGFSGGEKKRLELIQFLLLKPKFAIFDEIDSGIDVDGIKLLIKALDMARKENPTLSILLITHNPKMVELLNPNFVHQMSSGKIE